MGIEIETTLTLSQVQSVFGFILNIAGLAWSFLLTSIVKARMLDKFLNENEEITVTTQAQIVSSNHRAAAGSYAEVSEMMQKRSKSGVPSGIIVGQIPIDTRWKYNARFDVDQEFTRGNDSEIIGFEYINRLWTLRVHEGFRVPFNPDNATDFEIVLVPITVKAYTCKVVRVKEGKDGDYNLLRRYTNIDVEIANVLIGRSWNLAIINGYDTSIYEY
ncbi:12604_t:CDS:2, partial [Racocetra fulgida]